MKQLKGIGASSGINYAKAFIIEPPIFQILEDKIKDIDFEIKKVNESIKSTISQLEVIKNIAFERLGEDKASIFDAHIQIAQDPEIKSQIEELIKIENYNSASATNLVFNNMSEMFSSMDDAYFKERASDVIDVKNRMLSNLLNIKLPDIMSINSDVIIVAHDLSPSETAMLNKKFVKGFVTNIGGRTSHAAIMARTMEIPAVLGLNNITDIVKNDQIVAIDGSAGIVEINPNNIKEWEDRKRIFEKEKIELKKYVDKKATTLDNHTVLVEANIGKPSDSDNLNQYGADGVGLYRSEFLYMEASNWPDIDNQFNAYKYVLEKQPNNLVIVRTLDIGGDKKLPYYTFEHEDNPFLGYRAIRLTLDKVDIFKTQLKALLKASKYGKLGIMFPMICTIDELLKAKEILEKCKNELETEKIEFSKDIKVGMMIEIPSAALIADKFAKYVDFFSIGTNDLIQYTFAVDRMSPKISHLYQPNNPSLLKAIELTILGAKKHNVSVAMCGEMAGDIMSIPILLGLGEKGLDAFSMSSSSILRAKKLICNLKHKECIELAKKALELETAQQVNDLVSNFLKSKKLI
ncbi:phosphoenolpyruvate--protein phosphotransferase [Malacoplasma muris]|uniref:phosphoenolpyruvate--protein phosphotransferase n=1 Tax=Malacoplasma muris TaxID=2119 RepID=UPI00398E9A90